MANQSAAVLRYHQHWQPASTLQENQQAPKFAPLRLPGLHTVLPQGLARGIIAEIYGRRSSGRTSACLHVVAQATQRGEVCAVIDLCDSFHPESAAGAGVQLDALVWVRCCGNAEHAMRAADLVLHAGGFGVVLLDLSEAHARTLNRIPISYWHRFRRVIEQTHTILLVCGVSSQAKSCASVSLELRAKTSQWTGKSPFLLLRGLEISAVVSRTSLSNRIASGNARSMQEQSLHVGTVA